MIGTIKIQTKSNYQKVNIRFYHEVTQKLVQEDRCR